MSEETGAVSLACDAALAYDLNVGEVREQLSELLGASLEIDGEPREEVTELGD